MTTPTKNKKYLILKGLAGLGNRLASLTFAINYAKKTQRTLYVDWSDEMVSNGKHNVFHKFFELKNIDYSSNLQDLWTLKPHDVYPHFYYKYLDQPHNSIYQDASIGLTISLKRFIRFIPKGKLRMLAGYWKRLQNPTHISTFQFLTGLFQPGNFPFGSDLPLKLNHNIVIFADFIPDFSKDTFINHVQLNSETQKKLSDLLKKHPPQNCIGLHVRKTDKKPKSKLEEDKIIHLLNSMNLIKRPIFLASDNDDTLKNLREKLPNSFFFRKLKTYHSETPIHLHTEKLEDKTHALNAWEESILDMYFLSKCEYLFYQGNSSFTLPARALHSKPENQINWDL